MKVKTIRPEKGLKKWWNLLGVKPGRIVQVYVDGYPILCRVERCSDTECLDCALCNPFFIWADSVGNASLMDQMIYCSKWNDGKNISFIPMKKDLE